jgi:hypothetical protein
MILYFAADLLWATRIRAEADAAGIAARPVRTVEMLEDRLADSRVTALLVDLDSPQTAIELIRFVRASEAAAESARVQVVAWGPHVGIEAMESAKEAGADVVMARGAFASRLAELLKGLEAGASPES